MTKKQTKSPLCACGTGDDYVNVNVRSSFPNVHQTEYPVIDTVKKTLFLALLSCAAMGHAAQYSVSTAAEWQAAWDAASDGDTILAEQSIDDARFLATLSNKTETVTVQGAEGVTLTQITQLPSGMRLQNIRLQNVSAGSLSPAALGNGVVVDNLSGVVGDSPIVVIGDAASGNNLLLTNLQARQGGAVNVQSGSLLLGDGSAYRGELVIIGGTATIEADKDWGDTGSSVSIETAATLELSDLSCLVGSVRLAGTLAARGKAQVEQAIAVASASAAVKVEAGSTLTLARGLVDAAGAGSAELTKEGEGALQLGGNSGYSGTLKLKSGSLELLKDARLAAPLHMQGAALTIRQNATLAAPTVVRVYEEQEDGELLRVMSRTVRAASGLDETLELSAFGCYVVEVASYDRGAGRYNTSYELTLEREDEQGVRTRYALATR